MYHVAGVIYIPRPYPKDGVSGGWRRCLSKLMLAKSVYISADCCPSAKMHEPKRELGVDRAAAVPFTFPSFSSEFNHVFFSSSYLQASSPSESPVPSHPQDPFATVLKFSSASYAVGIGQPAEVVMGYPEQERMYVHRLQLATP
jgi:hypothetical protein